MGTVQERVIAAIQREIARNYGEGVEPPAVTLESDLQADLGMDSFDVVEGLMELEAEFETELDDDGFLQCRTVADVVAFVEKWLEGVAA
jgi:acyl carrier protein